MASVNRITLIGNLGADPETSTTQSGLQVTRISVATTDRRKDKEGNVKEKTDWHRVVFFGKQAEIAAQYLNKGDSVYIEGRVSYGSYEKEGVKHYSTDIIANELQFNSPKREGGNATSPAKASAPPASSAPETQFSDDDIPF